MSARRRFNLILTSVLIVGGFLFLEAKDDAIVYANETPTIADHLVISQAQITGGTGQTTNDFVEFYNPTSSSIDLNGYRLVKRTATGLTDASIKSWTSSSIVPAHGYYLWANSSYSSILTLPDATTTQTIADNNGIALRFGSEDTGAIIDSVAWGSASNVFVEDAAFPSNPEANQALIRKPNDSNGNGEDTNNNAQDFLIATSTPRNSSAPAVPPLSNENPLENPPPSSPPPPTPPAEEPSSSFSCLNTILISELLINPEDSNADYEFIELYNPVGQEVVLAGWTLQDTQGKVNKYLFPAEAKIPALGYIALYRPQTKITLNNSGEGARLIGAHGELCDASPPNSGLAKEDWSYARQEDGRWLWTSAATPGVKNVFQDPAAAVASSGSAAANSSSESAEPALDLKGSVVINELLPNPAGADKEEFIELKNLNSQEMNLDKWWLEDASRQKHIFSSSTVLAKDGFLVWWRQKSGLSLNNNGDTVKLFGPNRQLVDEVKYEEPAEENFSYSRVFATSTVWQWSKVMTPGVANVINLPNRPPVIIFELPNMAEVGEEIVFDASDTDDPEGDALSFLWDFGDGSQSVQEMATHTFQKAGRRKIVLKVNDHQGNEIEQKGYLTILGEGETDPVMDSENSTKSKNNQKSSGKEQVKMVGLVTVPPGLFSVQTFYLQDLQDAAGLQIYMFKKDFPSLQVGDKVEVAGEMSAIQSGRRLKIKSRADIKVLTRVGTGLKPVLTAEPEELAVADLSEEYLDGLVKVSGEVLEPKAGQFYLSDESGEVMIQFKSRSGLKGRLVKEGDAVAVTGILGQSKGEWRIWPRFVEDIKITGFSGEEANGSVAADEEKKTAKKYLTATAGGLTSLLLALFAKSRGASAKGLALGLISRVSFWKRKIDKE